MCLVDREGLAFLTQELHRGNGADRPKRKSDVRAPWPVIEVKRPALRDEDETMAAFDVNPCGSDEAFQGVILRVLVEAEVELRFDEAQRVEPVGRAPRRQSAERKVAHLVLQIRERADMSDAPLLVECRDRFGAEPFSA